MDTNNQNTQENQFPEKKPQKRSLFVVIKKYFWLIIILLIIATTSGILLANHETKTATNWQTYTSKDAGISFKHPRSFKIIEDRDWRITIYTSEQNTENNIKILYSHKDPLSEQDSAESQFLANCQATRVGEIDADGTRIKVYEDSTCGAQKIPESVIVYSENGMNYDIGLFGKTDRNQLYTFLSTFKFEKIATQSPLPSPTATLSDVPEEEGKKCDGIAGIQCAPGYMCQLVDDYPDTGGKCTKETNIASPTFPL